MSRLLATLLIPVSALTLTFPAAGRLLANSDAWVQLGPEGASVRTVIVDPQEPKIVYAGTAKGEVFRSSDGAASWIAASSGLFAPEGAAGINPLSINTLALDSRLQETLYAGTSAGVYRKVNGIWTLALESWGIFAIVVHPFDSATVYAGGQEGLFKSEDGGERWELLSRGMPGLDVTALVADPFDPDVLYLATASGGGGGQGIWKSTDGGLSWRGANSGLPDWPWVESLALDPGNSQILYAGLGDGVFRSTNGGARWEPTGWLPAGGTVVLAVDPTNPERVFAGIRERGLYLSLNGGSSWQRVISDTTVHSVAIDPQAPQNVYAGTELFKWSFETGEVVGGVYRSTDRGTSWTASNSGLHAAPVYSLAARSGPDGRTRLLGGGLGRVYTGDPAGVSWKTSFLGGEEVDSLAGNPWHPGALYASRFDTIYKSLDQGATWDAVWYSPGIIRDLAVDPLNAEVVYAATDDGVFKSTNGGTAWQAVNTGLPQYNGRIGPVQSLAVDPKDARIVYVGLLWSGVYKSTNAGLSWSPARSGLPSGFWSSGERVYSVVSSLTVDPHDSNVLYAGTGERSWPLSGRGIYRSADGGGNWYAINSGLPLAGAASHPVFALEIDPERPGTIYAGFYGSGVFKSTNGGGEWLEINDGLSDPFVRDLAIDPGDSSILYAATEGGGASILDPSSFPRSPALVFPQFANGGGSDSAPESRTRIILMNDLPRADTGVVQFYDASGGPLAAPIDGELRSSLGYEVEPWGSIELETDGTGLLQTGVIRVVSDLGEDSRISGVAAYEVYGHFVSVPGSVSSPSHAVYVSVTPEENTGLALYNPDAVNVAVLQLILRDSLGREVSSRQVILQPREQMVRFVTEEELFGGFYSLETEQFQGIIEILAGEGRRVFVLGLLQQAATGSLVAVSDSGPEEGILTFVQFANGEVSSVRNRTRIVLMNGAPREDQGQVCFQDSAGGRVTVPVNGGEAGLFDYSLQPNGTLEIVTDGTGDLLTGVIEVVSDCGVDSAIRGTAIFEVLGGLVSVPGSPARSAHRVYASVTRQENTGLALYNPAEADLARITLILLDDLGQEQSRRQLLLQPREQMVQFLTEAGVFGDFFQTFSGDYRGTLRVEVEGDGRVSALGLLQRSATGLLIAVPSLSE